jgi:hypothetical protein
MSYILDKVTDNWIFIRDSNSGKSITNDAENVVSELYHIYGDCRILYRDTEGQWDELVHRNGEFLKFKLHMLHDNDYMTVMDIVPDFR